MKYQIGTKVIELTEEKAGELVTDPQHEIIENEIHCFINEPNIATVVLKPA